MARQNFRPSVHGCVLAAILAMSLVFSLAAFGQEATDALNLRFSSDPMPELPPDVLDSGESFTLSLVVLLDGTSSSLSEDPIVEVSLRRQDKAVACITEYAVVPALDLLQVGSHTTTATIDTTGLLGGFYQVTARIEYAGYEYSTIDNLLVIGFIEIADARPELHPVSLSMDPAGPLLYGDTATLHTTIENTGRLSSGAFHVVFEAQPLDDGVDDWGTQPVASIRVPGLPRNEQIELTAPFVSVQIANEDALPATLAVRVRVVYPAPTTSVDHVQDQPDELDSSNNVLQIATRVVSSRHGLPDLIPLSIVFDEDLPLRWDDNMNVTVTVANLGGSATQDGQEPIVRFRYRLAGDTEWNDPVDKVIDDPLSNEIGENEVLKKVTINPEKIGVYELMVEVDPPGPADCGAVAERNEDNNILVVGFTVLGTELQVQALELASNKIYQGDAVTVRASVVNTADRAADEFVAAFYLSGERFDTFLYQGSQDSDAGKGGLEEGERTYVEGLLNTRDLPPGDYDLRVVIDPDNRIPEYDEANNTISTPLTIHAPEARLAELHVSGVRFDPSSPIPEESMAIATLTVENSGEIDSGFFHLTATYLPCTTGCDETFEEGEPLLDSTGNPIRQLLFGLERNEIQSVNIPFSTHGMPQGSYRVRFEVDPIEIVEEQDEDNNAVFTIFSIGAPAAAQPGIGVGLLPNLSFQHVEISPDAVVGIGDSVDIRMTVINAGGGVAGPFHLKLLWVTPTGATYQLLSRRIDGLAPGQTWDLPETSVQTALPMGTYTIVGVIDADGAVSEADESDNEFRAAIAVGQAHALQADLVPTAVRFAPESGVAISGQDLLAHVTIHNQGPLAAGQFVVSASWSTGSATETVRELSPLESKEITFTIPSLAGGNDAITIVVDAGSVVPESNEANNALYEEFAVLGIQLASTQLLFQESAEPIALELDAASGTLYAAFANGRIWKADRAGNTELVADTGQAVTSFVRIFGMRNIGYLGTATGRAVAIDLGSGEQLLESESFGSAVRALAVDSSTAVYLLTADKLAKLDGSLALVVQTSIPGAMDASLDAGGDTLYVLASTGLRAFDTQLNELCSASSFSGTPTVLAVGSAGIFVGTGAGVVHALSLCTSYSNSGPMMPMSWRYPVAGTLDGGITSLVIDERDIDPVFVTTSEGVVVSLAFTGTPFWTFEASSGIHAIPAVDARSGRLLVGDNAGRPYVLDSDGSEAFAVNPTAHAGASIRGNLLVDEVRRQTDTGTKLIRIYYYGASNGGVYKLESSR